MPQYINLVRAHRRKNPDGSYTNVKAHRRVTYRGSGPYSRREYGRWMRQDRAAREHPLDRGEIEQLRRHARETRQRQRRRRNK